MRRNEEPRFRLELFGGFAFLQCDRSGRQAVRIAQRKGRGLLAYLACAPDQRVSRDRLADLLWSDRGDRHARQSLRQSLLELRQAMSGSDLCPLDSDAEEVWLEPGLVTSDVAEFERFSGSDRIADLERACSLYGGPFLDGLYLESEVFVEWMEARRLKLEALARRAFAAVAADREARGDPGAVGFAERLASLDPLDEGVIHLLLRLYRRHSGRDAALAYAEGISRKLRSEMGVEPNKDIRALMAEIRADTPRSAPAPALPSGVEPGGLHGSLSGDVGDVVGRAPSAVGQERSASWGLPKPAAIAAACIAVGVALAMLLELRGLVFSRQPPARSVSAAHESPSIWDMRLLPNARQAAAALERRSYIPLAVMPFRAAAPEDAEYAQRLTEDLIGDLSRSSGLRVISWQSVRHHAGQDYDSATVGADFGVRYLVEGTVETQGEAVRVNVSLVDAKDRTQVWSRRIDAGHARRFEIRDDIVRGLARQMNVAIRHAQATASGREDTEAHALAARGMSEMMKERPKFPVAHSYFTQALAKDPAQATARIGLAVIHAFRAANRHPVAKDDPDLESAERQLAPVLAAQPDNSAALLWLGFVRKLQGDLDEAFDLLSRAIDSNPSNAPAYAQLGHVLALRDRPEEALRHVRYAMALSPRDHLMWNWSAIAAHSEFALQRYDAAIEWAMRSLALEPRSIRPRMLLAAAHALNGNPSQAARHAEELRKLLPGRTPAEIAEGFLFGGSDTARRYREGVISALTAQF